MTALRMALSELARLTAGRTAQAALVAMLLVPTLYGGLYLYANHDPYANLDQVPAALVVLDEGAESASGKPVQAGREIAENLKAEGAFDWTEVAAARAESGVREGTYQFALTIPADFSAALTSTGRFDAEQARLTMTTNDANSYLSTTIANTVIGQVRAAITAQVGRNAATEFLLGFDQIRGSLAEAEQSTRALVAGTGRADAQAASLRQFAEAARIDAAEVAGSLASTAERAADLNDRIGSLSSRADRVASATEDLSAEFADVDRIGDRVSAAAHAAEESFWTQRSNLVSTMAAMGLNSTQRAQILNVYDRSAGPIGTARATGDQAERDLGALARSGGGDLADQAADLGGVARGLGSAAEALAAEVAAAGADAARASTRSNRTSEQAGDLDRLLSDLPGAEALGAISAGLAAVPGVDEDDRAAVAATVADPVRVEAAAQAAADSYGAGLAPFFLALAVWVGGYGLLLLLRPLSRRALAANQHPVRVALGGVLPGLALGVLQVLLLLGVVAGVVGIVPENLPGTVVFLALVSACFVAILHALKAWFGAAGQFLGLVLLVLQLVSAGGTFPWQTLPAPLHPVHQALPMSYAVDGLRQLFFGGLSDRVLTDALVLGGWLLVAVVASIWAAARQRVWSLDRLRPGLSLA